MGALQSLRRFWTEMVSAIWGDAEREPVAFGERERVTCGEKEHVTYYLNERNSNGSPERRLAEVEILYAIRSELLFVAHGAPGRASVSFETSSLLHHESNQEPAIFRTMQANKQIGSEGGIIRIAGSRVRIPRSAETQKRQFTLKMIVPKRAINRIGDWLLFGPEIVLRGERELGPQPAVIEVATCYVLNDLFSQVRVQIQRGGLWEEHDADVSISRDKLKFPTREYGRFRFLLHDIPQEQSKSISHTLYIKESVDNKFTLTWCFYDNLPEATSEVQKQMALNGFGVTGVKGSFMASSHDFVEISLKSDDGLVKDFTRRIGMKDMMMSDAMIMMDVDTNGYEKDLDKELRERPADVTLQNGLLTVFL